MSVDSIDVVALQSRLRELQALQLSTTFVQDASLSIEENDERRKAYHLEVQARMNEAIKIIRTLRRTNTGPGRPRRQKKMPVDIDKLTASLLD